MVANEHTATTAGLRPPRPTGVRAWEVWFGFLGGISAFLTHLIIMVWSTPLACSFNTIPLHVTSAVFMAVAVAALVVSIRASRRLRARERETNDSSSPPAALSGAYLTALLLQRSRLAKAVLSAAAAAPSSDSASAPEGDIAAERTQFMALAGIYLNLLGIMVIAFSWAATFVLNPCI